MREKPGYQEIIQLGFVALTDAPAIDIQMEVSPSGDKWPEYLRTFKDGEPIEFPVVDRQNPLFFDLATRHDLDMGKLPEFDLRFTYHDLAGNAYTEQRKVNPKESLYTLRFFPQDRVAEAIDNLRQMIDQRLPPYRPPRIPD